MYLLYYLVADIGRVYCVLIVLPGGRLRPGLLCTYCTTWWQTKARFTVYLLYYLVADLGQVYCVLIVLPGG